MRPNRLKFLSAAALLVWLVIALQPASAGKPVIFATNGIAINGMDAVAYFSQNRAVEGSAEHALKWRGAVWLFASQENLARFLANPTAYAPQYGGYCAYAVAKGSTASTDPDAFTVYQDRLYLNYSKPVQGLWAADKPGHIASANANWPGVLGR